MSESRSELDLAALRREYGEHGLDTPDLEPDPLEMFRRWLDDAVRAPLHEPNAMVVTTVSAAGSPSARMVLLKGLDEGFVFYTNYDSRKGREIEANPAVSLLFPWHDLQRQVRVEGTASRVSAEESQAYFSSRPKESQVGAWASPQSQPVQSRDELDELYDAAQRRFADAEEIPVPPHWGGLRVRPEVVEFWQGRKGRMHDRLVYRRANPWTVQRLAP
jgi:pyridoxamine 5'-phosphate oxidase